MLIRAINELIIISLPLGSINPGGIKHCYYYYYIYITLVQQYYG